MSYLEFYNFETEPFANSVNTKFFFNSQHHMEALLRLRYAIDYNKGLAVLVGDVGTGKTTLAQKMLESMDEVFYESVLLIIIHNNVTSEWFLTKMARQLGVKDIGSEKTDLLSQIYKRLVYFHEAGKKVAILIDEAQMLINKELMEDFRGLLNIEVDGKKLVTFILFGLPEIDECLNLDKALKQRVAIRHKLKNLSAIGTHDYVKFRMQIAGAKRNIFTPKAIETIHLFSNGIPRVINTIGDNALFQGFLVKVDEIDENIILEIADDLSLAS